MSDALIQLALFTAKSCIIVLMILIVLMAFLVLLAKAKQKMTGRLVIKNVNQKYDEAREALLAETLPKKQFKQFLKNRKAEQKAKEKSQEQPSNVFVLDFNGDIKATAVDALREEITAVLSAAAPQDEVVLRLESGGGTVHGYGLAAAQLMRFRAANIPLTVIIDKIAASGGYLMACVANQILSAPFAIVGSIGVIVQLPNFNRLLKDKHIDFEQLTAGEYKRTLTVFGENTDAGRQKLKEEIEDVHQQFKQLILSHRPQINIQEVATGEYWRGPQALSLRLIDLIKTSDEYLLERSKKANVYELAFEIKKSFFSKLTGLTSSVLWKLIFTAFRIK